MEPIEFEDGFRAFADGKDIRNNPHWPAQGNGSWLAWARGWCAALLFDMQEKRKKAEREADGEDKCENWRQIGTEDTSEPCGL